MTTTTLTEKNLCPEERFEQITFPAAYKKARGGHDDHDGFLRAFYLYLLDRVAKQNGCHQDEALDVMSQKYQDIYVDMSMGGYGGIDNTPYKSWMMKINFDVDFEITEEDIREWVFDGGGYDFEAERCSHEYDCCGRYYWGMIDIHVNRYVDRSMSANRPDKWFHDIVITRKAYKNI